MFYVKDFNGYVYPSFKVKEAAVFAAERILEGRPSESPCSLGAKLIMKRGIENLASGPKQYKKCLVETESGIEELKCERPFLLCEDGKIVNPGVFKALAENEYPDMSALDLHELRRAYVYRENEERKRALPKGKGAACNSCFRPIHYAGTLREKEDPESKAFGIEGYRSRRVLNAWDIEPIAVRYKSWKAEKKEHQFSGSRRTIRKDFLNLTYGEDPWKVFAQDAS